MTSVPLATAATLYHRFFHHFSKDDFDPYVCITLPLLQDCYTVVLILVIHKHCVI